MSKEAALAFLQKALSDGDLQAKLVTFAKDQGYEFSVEELSDVELDAAAGGGVFVKYKAEGLATPASRTIKDLGSIRGAKYDG